MEKRMKGLFDYQRFQRDPRLDAMLREAEARYGSGIADDDLELVSAAGYIPPVDETMLIIPLRDNQ